MPSCTVADGYGSADHPHNALQLSLQRRFDRVGLALPTCYTAHVGGVHLQLPSDAAVKASDQRRQICGGRLWHTFTRAMRLLENYNQRSGQRQPGLTNMLTHFDLRCNHCMQKFTLRRRAGPAVPLFDYPIYPPFRESKAIFRSFFCLPGPDGPAARPSGDKDARCAV